MNYEIVSSADLVSNNLFNQQTFFLSSEDPITDEENLIKLNNQIKHMTFNIEQNRRRSESLSKDCYTLLRSTELLAFDFLFSNYLLGDTDSQTIYTFFERCFYPSFNISSSQEIDFKKASDHISYLQDIIKKCAQSLFQKEIKIPNIPKRISEFILYLKNQKMKLEREIKQKNIHHQNSQGNNPNQQKKSDLTELSGTTFEYNEDVLDISTLPLSFTKWLSAELKVSLTPDEESKEIQNLIKDIAFNLAEITQLNESINSLKKSVVDPNQLDIHSCSPESIEKSPFFIGVKNNCHFLMAAFNSMKSQETVIPVCFNALEKCREKLLMLTESFKKSISEMQKQIDKMREAILQRQKMGNLLIKDLQPFIDVLLMKKPLPQIPPEPIKFYNNFENILKNEIKSTKSDSEHSRKLNEQLDMLAELRKVREDLSYLCEENVNLIKQIEEKDSAILKLDMDVCKAEEEIRLHSKELDQISKYEEGLREVLDSLKFNEMGEWCDKLGEIGGAFAYAASNQRKILQDLQNFMNKNENINDQIESKKKEIEELSAQNYSLCIELGKRKLELNSVLEEHFREEQELQSINDYVPNYIDKNNTEEIDQYRKMVTCPICKANRRDSILTSCGHPICRSCVEKASGKCPICSCKFSDHNIKPFFV
ncbi:hypothetical protein TRFO_18114 [Tritrichomonas foetus]|uniref:E3 ubiquitin protein ligase n=1 Tax=Tritrichomonas foetus TaxID=1144522 RepID=A0A1J4KRB2_9EUKA|nr:hypothetical protein TRFO_18114 [Tritrichomonas foetus]|eukprot:OHT12206.1 hypothetical protein TRFO_18114 [Tritrichomonas foetus]